jgi:glycosyltransferase involved in cell wall biosynthesis
MGVPAVATPVEGIGELLDHGRAGELVAKDDVTALADAVQRILHDPAHTESITVAARSHCLEHYAIDVVAAMWDRVLRRVQR